MYEIDEFGCFVLQKHDLDLVKAYRYYRTAIICAEEISDELWYEEEEKYFSFETYVRWYEAIEKAVVIWLYYLGTRVSSGTRSGGVHRYHETFLWTLSYPDNPFVEIFNRDYLLANLRLDKQIRDNGGAVINCFRILAKIGNIWCTTSILSMGLWKKLSLYSARMRLRTGRRER